MREAKGYFSEGDPVMVRDGVEHPELGNNIGGWQGWVTEIILDETFGELVAVAWDSQTLAAMPQEHREEAEVAGIDFTRAILIPHELNLVAPRDEPADALDVAATLDESFDWDYLGKQGERIREVIAGTATKREALQRWVGFLAQSLEFPFAAEVAIYREQGPLQEGDIVDVRRISLVDDKHGIIVGVRFRNQQYDLPLFDLEGVDELSPSAQYVDDYAVWWDESEDHSLSR